MTYIKEMIDKVSPKLGSLYLELYLRIFVRRKQLKEDLNLLYKRYQDPEFREEKEKTEELINIVRKILYPKNK